MADRPQHFTFAEAPFQSGIAHRGDGQIDSARVVADTAGGGAAWIDLVVVPPGCSIGEHRHGDDQETYVIVDGSASMVVDGSEIQVGPGDVIVNRPGGTHGLRNIGTDPLRLVVMDVALRAPERPDHT
jgi:mannose-6-phosphate isomerase-like protein (cupin superfamily)